MDTLNGVSQEEPDAGFWIGSAGPIAIRTLRAEAVFHRVVESLLTLSRLGERVQISPMEDPDG